MPHFKKNLDGDLDFYITIPSTNLVDYLGICIYYDDDKTFLNSIDLFNGALDHKKIIKTISDGINIGSDVYKFSDIGIPEGQNYFIIFYNQRFIDSDWQTEPNDICYFNIDDNGVRKADESKLEITKIKFTSDYHDISGNNVLRNTESFFDIGTASDAIQDYEYVEAEGSNYPIVHKMGTLLRMEAVLNIESPSIGSDGADAEITVTSSETGFSFKPVTKVLKNGENIIVLEGVTALPSKIGHYFLDLNWLAEFGDLTLSANTYEHELFTTFDVPFDMEENNGESQLTIKRLEDAVWLAEEKSNIVDAAQTIFQIINFGTYYNFGFSLDDALPNNPADPNITWEYNSLWNAFDLQDESTIQKGDCRQLATMFNNLLKVLGAKETETEVGFVYPYYDNSTYVNYSLFRNSSQIKDDYSLAYWYGGPNWWQAVCRVRGYDSDNEYKDSYLAPKIIAGDDPLKLIQALLYDEEEGTELSDKFQFFQDDIIRTLDEYYLYFQNTLIAPIAIPGGTIAPTDYTGWIGNP